MTARRVYVLGTGGLAREILQLMSQVDPARERWEMQGYVAGDAAEVGSTLGRYPVVGDDSWLLASRAEADVVMGVGHPRARIALAERYSQAADRLEFPSLVHPSAVFDDDEVEMGIGNVITAGCVLTVDVRMGHFNLINWNSTVGHGVRMGDGNVINPGASISGDVVLGDGVLVGTGARILEGRSVGSGARVGAGAVVTEDIADGLTVVGVPARPIEPDLA